LERRVGRQFLFKLFDGHGFPASRAGSKIQIRQTNFWSKAMKSPWTPDRRAQQAAAIHRWKPWEKSTGPRTFEGKAIISRNAFKGGKRALLRQHMAELQLFLRPARPSP
jgi:hypothetical protein